MILMALSVVQPTSDADTRKCMDTSSRVLLNNCVTEILHPALADDCCCPCWSLPLLVNSWIQYYLSLDSLGPTVGVSVTYAAPAAAFDTNSSAALTRDPADQSSSTNSDGGGGGDGAELRSQLSVRDDVSY